MRAPYEPILSRCRCCHNFARGGCSSRDDFCRLISGPRGHDEAGAEFFQAIAAGAFPAGCPQEHRGPELAAAAAARVAGGG